MESLVTDLLGLVTGTLRWGLDNALPIAAGALFGSGLVKAGLGLVGDLLGRAKGLCDDVTSTLSGKK